MPDTGHLVASALQVYDFSGFRTLVDVAGGRERTEDALRTLFARAGFELTRVVPTPSPLSVIEARRV